MAETSASAGSPRFEGEFTTGRHFATKATAAELRYSLLRRRSVLQLGGALVAVFAVAALSWLRGAPGYLVVPFAFLVLIVIVYVIAFVIGQQSIRKRLPPGSRLSIGLRDNTMLITAPDVTSAVAYGQFRTAERRGSFVFLRRRDGGVAMYPGELFTPESLDFLRHKLAADG